MSKTPPIFVINLKRESARREHITAHLQQHGLSHEIIDAVDGRELSEAQIAAVYSLEKTMQHIKRPLSKGEIACALSHFSIWQKMCDEDIAEAIIIEDDAVLHENFMAKVQEAKKILPQDWQILLLGYSEHTQDATTSVQRHVCHVSVAKSKHSKIIMPLEIATSTHCYLIGQAGAKYLLDELKFKPQQLRHAIDQYTGDPTFVRVYCLAPRCARYNPFFPSSIPITTPIVQATNTSLWQQIKNTIKAGLPWLDPLLWKLKLHYFCGIKIIRYFLKRRL